MKFCIQKFLFSLSCILLLSGATAMAQRQITGKVTDAENGEALIGASVAAVGAAAGAITDVDGNYKINLPDGATALSFRYTGFKEKTVQLGNSNVVDVALSSGLVLEETVVVGYGRVKREDATGLVQTVTSSNFNRGAITGAQDLLVGKISGVVITSDPGPGSGAKIRIRGESSLSASNNPLIVIDGIPLDNGGVSGSRNQLNFINPNDVESITVLKDASSAAIYGNRASGGVILITTKKGSLDKKLRVGYSANVSVGQNYNRVDMLTADEFRQAVQTRYADQANQVAIGLLGDANTDWQSEIYQNAWGHDHNLSLSGGVFHIPYRLSMGYTNKDGVLKTDNFDRYSGALNLTPGFLNNTLQVNLHFKGMLSNNHFAERGAIGSALSFDPTKPVRDITSPYGFFTTWTTNTGAPNGLAPANPVALLELRDDNSTVKQFITNGSVDYRFKFLPALRANLSLGYDYSKGEGTVVVPNFASFAYDAINGGGVNNQYEQTKKNSVLESYLNYKKSFGDHDLDVMGGYSWQHFEVDNYFKNSDSAGTPAETTEGRDPAELFLISLYGRVNYGFKNKLLLTASLRRDGTSRFAPKYRWGVFPAAAIAYKFAENDHQYFNSVKMRLSWGITGQQDIGDYYAYLARYQFGTPNASYQFGSDFYTTLRPNGYVGDIKWEETTAYNYGLDVSIIKNRLSGSMDFYLKYTKDLLNFIPFPALSNLTNFGTDNIGTMRTEGGELNLNITPVVNKNVQWDLSTNFALTKSTITKLTTSDDPGYKGVFVGGIAGGVGSNIQIHSVDYAPNTFYVFKQLYDENGTLLEDQFADLNNDGTVNDEDKYRYKNPTPLVTIGLNNSLKVMDFSMSFAGRFNVGQYVYNNVQTDMGYLNRLFHTTKYLQNVHQSAVDLNVLDQSSLTFSDHFVKKATFFRLDHVTVGYDFKRLTGLNLNLSFTVQNPLVVTQYDGLDPEIGNGIDNNVYPRPRTYLLGLGIQF